MSNPLIFPASPARSQAARTGFSMQQRTQKSRTEFPITKLTLSRKIQSLRRMDQVYLEMIVEEDYNDSTR
jgi:hypothetical protein